MRSQIPDNIYNIIYIYFFISDLLNVLPGEIVAIIERLENETYAYARPHATHRATNPYMHTRMRFHACMKRRRRQDYSSPTCVQNVSKLSRHFLSVFKT